MAIFAKQTNTEKLQGQLATLTGPGDRLATKRSAAQEELREAEKERLSLFTESDGEDLKAEVKAQDRVDRARSTLEGISAAITALAGQVVSIEQEIAAEEDRKARAESAARIEAEVAEVERCLAAALPPLKKLRQALYALHTVSRNASEAGGCIQYWLPQVELAAATGIKECRELADQVANGRAPVPNRRTGEEIKLPRPAPAPEGVRVFTIKSVRWTVDGQDGGEHLAAQYKDIQLSPTLAERALAMRVAVPPNDPKAKEFRGWPSRPPELATAVNLNAAPGAIEPISEATPESPPSMFERIDRGPAITGTARVA